MDLTYKWVERGKHASVMPEGKFFGTLETTNLINNAGLTEDYSRLNLQRDNPDKATKARVKDPLFAFLQSFLIPGMGQAYNEQYVKAASQFALATVSMTLFIKGIEDDYETFGGYYVDPDGDTDAGTAGCLIYGVTWLWSIIDAPYNAYLINKENQLYGNRIKVDIDSIVSRDRSGIILAFRW